MDTSTTAAGAGADLAEIDRLSRRARERDRPTLEANLVRHRYDLGRRLIEAAARSGRRPSPPPVDAVDPFPDVHGRPPEITRAALDADLLRGALRHHGCLLVHDFLGETTMARLRDDTDQMEAGFDEWLARGHRPVMPWFAPLDAPGAELPLSFRTGCGPLGTFYAADSPRALRHLVDAFDEAGLRTLLVEYMGEPVVLSLEKSSLRHVPPTVPQAWHQDGQRMGAELGLVNVWIALSECGVEAPGLGVLPRRPTEILPLATDSPVPWEIDHEALVRAAGDVELLTLHLQPGDAVLFDEMLVHSTHVEVSMTRSRYCADAWFFPASGFPTELYRPLAYAHPEGPSAVG